MSEEEKAAVKAAEEKAAAELAAEEKEGVKPEEKSPLDGMTDEQKKLFSEANAGLLSALDKERGARKSLEKAAKDEAADRLKEEGRFKELYEASQLELAGVKPKADLAEEYETSMQAFLAAEIEALPENKRSMVPSELPTLKQINWIGDHKTQLMKSPAPDIGALEMGGTDIKGVDLTANQKAMARNLGQTDDEYAKGLRN